MFYTNPILEKLEQNAKVDPIKRVIVETTGKVATSQELADSSRAVAANLAEAGFKQGHKVLILARPGVDLVVFILAVMRLGGVVVVADPGMGKDVFLARVRAASPEWVFGEAIIFALRYHPILKYILKKRGYDMPDLPLMPGVKKIRVGFALFGNLFSFSYKRLLRPRAAPDVAAQLPCGAPVLVVFTSGTTSQPKGVVHTSSSLSATIEKVAAVIQPAPNDVFATSLAHFLLLAVSLGVIAVVEKEKFSAQGYFKMLEAHKPTILFGPPAEFIELVSLCRMQGQKFPEFIKKIFLGSAPVLGGFLQNLIKYIPETTQIAAIYGMTEILPISVVDGRAKAVWEGVGDLLGKVVPGVTYSLATDGELIVSGDHQCTGYLGQPALESVYTGDLVTEVGGELVLVGRKKDMIIKGNYNIYPELYESTIQKIPGVAACTMVGVPDEAKADEKIVLVIEPEDPSDAALANRVLGLLKQGQYSIDVQALPDTILLMKLPRSGRQQKIDKKQLRKVAS